MSYFEKRTKKWYFEVNFFVSHENTLLALELVPFWKDRYGCEFVFGLTLFYVNIFFINIVKLSKETEDVSQA